MKKCVGVNLTGGRGVKSRNLGKKVGKSRNPEIENRKSRKLKEEEKFRFQELLSFASIIHFYPVILGASDSPIVLR